MTTTDHATAPTLLLEDVTHRFGPPDTGVVALAPLDLRVAAGSFVAVVGPSGCGKSTLLRLLAGLDTATGGRIDVGGDTPDAVRRAGHVGWMAQRPALLPWSSVHDNVALARRIRPVPDDRPSVADLLDLVGLAEVSDARPGQLSGGMQQRAALARTLAQDAPLWLMDEPFAALDELTREALARDLLAIWQDLRPTVVWVTHDLAEAATLADRVVVLGPRPGRVLVDLPVRLPHPRDRTSAGVQAVVRTAREHLGSPVAPAAAGARA